MNRKKDYRENPLQPLAHYGLKDSILMALHLQNHAEVIKNFLFVNHTVNQHDVAPIHSVDGIKRIISRVVPDFTHSTPRTFLLFIK